MKTWHIHIEGQVQGVGFRPFVYREAMRHNLNGLVNNGVNGVHIRFNAEPKQSRLFYDHIISNAPPLSRIMRHSLKQIGFEWFSDFSIVESSEVGSPNLLLTPDFALCPECEKELFSEDDRRYNYPFITCTNCGPRYSIVRTLPYDRPRTTMAAFEMCQKCKQEYNDPLNRRHYSQTNSCEPCGIRLSLEDHDGIIESGEADSLIDKACKLILEGKIVGIKGIGGYLVFADATDKHAVELLRKRKHRPTKPFALMYPDNGTVRMDAVVSFEEDKLIHSVASPIVLLKLKEQPVTGIAVDSIAPGLNEIGVMRPYAPLFAMMMDKLDRPVIATSGNISGSPVIYQNEKAKDQLLGICDAILSNDRDIVVPQDDSVEKILPDGNKVVLRRSRGYAPTFIHNSFDQHVMDMLSMGALLKSSFALTHNGNTYISQYLGDLESYDTQLSYKHTIDHFFTLFKPKPTKIIVDKHPDYFSTQRGKEIGKELGIPVKEIQHHEAHFMAVLAENDLTTSDQDVLGVIWDGTGLGHDRMIWGGEYFVYNNREIRRVNHIPYYQHILGDKFAYEPRLAALSLCHSFCLNTDSLISGFSSKEWELYNKILSKKDNLETSSMGRVFDGISNILGITDHNTFEGEAAMHLQACAEDYARRNGLIDNTFISLTGDLSQCLNEIMVGTNAGVDACKLAYDFHNWLVNRIKNEAYRQNTEKIVFSGGVFQNSLLLYLIKKRLDEDFELYFHKQLSPNDENISFGQLVYEYAGVKSLEGQEKKEDVIEQNELETLSN